MNAGTVDLSVLVPVYDEAPNLETLYREIIDALEPTGRSFEFLFVDDGSTDDSVESSRPSIRGGPRVTNARSTEIDPPASYVSRFVTPPRAAKPTRPSRCSCLSSSR